MRILLVEDNSDLAASITDYLELLGHTVDIAINGLSGLQQASDNNYDLYILDVVMPKLDGLSLCHQLRNDYLDTTPIIFLTARDTLDDKLAGFAAGADDYLVKPFDMSELVARITALHKRSVGIENTLSIADLSINLNTEEVTVNGESIALSPYSYRLLVVLMQRSPRLVTREELEYLVWGDDVPDSDSLRSHIYKLRSKVDKPFNRTLIKTIKGRGFCIS